MRVEPVQRIEFDSSDWPTYAPVFPQPVDGVPFKEALTAAILADQAKCMNLSQDDAHFFISAGKRWARRHLGLFAEHE